ncbi:MAG: TonB-dependent receptor [Spirochaetales bacterium]|nr:TonB-dependent receptor [Spirochaetales bacterium]
MKRLIIILLAMVSAAAFADVEIIVTASRIEEDSRTTPAYVRVIPEEEIQDESTVLDVLKTIPDISIREFSPAKQAISMGGFGDGGYGRTLILINGRPVNRPDMASFDWNSITLASVSRIEIIKGSMSSQYGDQAVAGVINIITKQPEGLTAIVSASVASTLSNNQSAFVSYGNEKTGLAAGINRIDNKSTRDRSDSTILSANIDSFYNISSIETKLGFYYSNSEYKLPGSLSVDQYDDDPDQAIDQEDEGESLSYGVNGSFDFALGPVDISVPVSYSVVDYISDMTSWFSFSDTYLGTTAAGIKASGAFYAGDSLEITPVGGIDFKQNNLSLDKYSSADRTVKTVENELTRIDSAFWARVKVNYLDTYILDGGLRYNYSDLDTDPGVVHEELVYDAGAVYLISPELNVSLRYGKVFRYPNLNEQVSYYYGPLTVNAELKPETGHNYTASIDYKNNNFQISLAPYLISMEDEIAYVYDPVTFSGSNENIGSTLHYGASVESGFSMGIAGFSAGYAYDHAEFTDTDKIIPRVPEHTVYGSITVSPVKAVTVSNDGRYSSEFFTDQDNTDTVQGRFDWNMRVNWNVTEDFAWYIKANNILDDRTPTFAYSDSSWYPMPGRTFETGLKWVY